MRDRKARQAKYRRGRCAKKGRQTVPFPISRPSAVTAPVTPAIARPMIVAAHPIAGIAGAIPVSIIIIEERCCDKGDTPPPAAVMAVVTATPMAKVAATTAAPMAVVPAAAPVAKVAPSAEMPAPTAPMATASPDVDDAVVRLRKCRAGRVRPHLAHRRCRAGRQGRKRYRSAGRECQRRAFHPVHLSLSCAYYTGVGANCVNLSLINERGTKGFQSCLPRSTILARTMGHHLSALTFCVEALAVGAGVAFFALTKFLTLERFLARFAGLVLFAEVAGARVFLLRNPRASCRA